MPPKKTFEEKLNNSKLLLNFLIKTTGFVLTSILLVYSVFYKPLEIYQIAIPAVMMGLDVEMIISIVTAYKAKK